MRPSLVHVSIFTWIDPTTIARDKGQGRKALKLCIVNQIETCITTIVVIISIIILILVINRFP